MKKTILLTFCLLASLLATAQVTFNFDMGKRGPSIGKDHYGIFYEEINHAGDGGLYAELVRNRSFEEDANSPIAWSMLGSGSIKLDTQNLLNIHQGHSLKVNCNSTTSGIRNDGYWGMKFTKDEVYQLSFWVMTTADWSGRFTANLLAGDGTICGKATITTSLEAGQWKKLTTEITATQSVQSGRFSLKMSKKGIYYIDVVSLFPPTFKDRKNGMRKDIGQMLYDLKPGFVRFPGGCYIEGLWANGKDNRFEWKKTIGPIEERPGHRNQNWGYQITDGQGYHEYLEMCEDLGADAMFVINMGWGHGWQVSINDIQPYIQEALDAIEYAMGDVSTPYGQLRAQNGHPEPFSLKYIEIGNENEGFDHYPDRFAEFYKAIKAKWPEIHLIANGNWTNAFPAEIQDEHYYMSPEWFISQYHKYDDYPRSKAKVYVGEYAVTQNPGAYGNLNAAIGEAVFMQGMENNSDVCVMGSYAPIFANENYVWWHPDMIRFNANISYGTPSYYVQKLFANNVGKQNIKWTETDNLPPVVNTKASIGVGTWATAATFSDLHVEAVDASFDASSTSDADWTAHGGTWSFDNGTFQQTNTTVTPAYYTYNTPFDNTNLTYTLKATKKSGDEGFLILIDYRDENNFTWWNLGGWGNTRHGIERCIAGAKTLVTDKSGTLQIGHEYTITIKKTDNLCQCYLDGELIHEFNMTGVVEKAAYVSANIDEEQGKLYVKLVNPSATSTPAILKFKNGRVTAAEAQVMTSTYGTDENSTSNTKKVIPKNKSVTIESDGSINYQVPAYSVNVLILDVVDVTLDEETATLPSPLVRYGFESGVPQDDSGKYRASLEGGASIVTMSDGNHCLYTGEIGEKGYMNLGTDMPNNVLPMLEDYTISMNILLGVNNTTSSYAWAYAMANGTGQYIGLVNAAGNGNWYYEIKNGSTQHVRGNAGLNPALWHNITYTQQGTTGRLYIDGQLRNTGSITLTPVDLAASIKDAWIARSPFTADAYLENVFIDDFRIYNQALTEAQVAVINQTTARRLVPETVYDGITDQQDLENLVKLVKNYVNESGDENLSTTFTNAQKLLKSTNTVQKKEAYNALKTAADDYAANQLNLARAGVPANLTCLLKNSSFTMGPSFWMGADMPFAPVEGNPNGVIAGYTGETAEQFSRSFNIYQDINGLPAGAYALTATAFYRTGVGEDAYNAFIEQQDATKYAEIYLNDNATPLTNLFAENSYSYDPYTFPATLAAANKAFNTLKRYAGNRVGTTIEEGQTLRCGIRKLTTVTDDWVAYDNFQLFYLGETDAIGNILPDKGQQPAVQKIEYFSPSGIWQPSIQKGINIIRITFSDHTTKHIKIFKE